MKKLTLSERCIIHARKADDAGLYTTGNLLEELSYLVEKNVEKKKGKFITFIKIFLLFFTVFVGGIALLASPLVFIVISSHTNIIIGTISTFLYDFIVSGIMYFSYLMID